MVVVKFGRMDRASRGELALCPGGGGVDHEAIDIKKTGARWRRLGFLRPFVCKVSRKVIGKDSWKEFRKESGRES
jgi:hypothetical protein